MARILIVEDDPSVTRLLELVLGVEGHTTETVTTGTLARDRLRGDPVDLVVLDVMLPEVDGLTVLSDLRSRRGWDTVRVVVLSALDADDDVWRGWASGADYYLTKPFELPDLRSVVERLLAGEDLSSGEHHRAAELSLELP